MKSLSQLTEREVLALAISSEPDLHGVRRGPGGTLSCFGQCV